MDVHEIDQAQRLQDDPAFKRACSRCREDLITQLESSVLPADMNLAEFDARLIGIVRNLRSLDDIRRKLMIEANAKVSDQHE